MDCLSVPLIASNAVLHGTSPTHSPLPGPGTPGTALSDSNSVSVLATLKNSMRMTMECACTALGI